MKLLYNVRNQVFFVIICLAAIAFAGHFTVLQPMLHKELQEHELAQISSAAKATAQTLDLQVRSAVQSLESLAGLDAFRNLDQSLISGALATFDATNPFYIYTWALDADGRVIAAPSRPDRLGEDRSYRDYFMFSEPRNPTHFQKVQISTRGNFSLVVGTVILDDAGKKIGVLAGSLGLMDRNPGMYQSVLNAPFPDEYTIALYSSNRILLAHSDKKLPQPSRENLRMLATQPFMEYLDGMDDETRSVEYKGQKFSLCYAAVPSADWTVVVQVPDSIISHSVGKITASLSVMLGIMLFVILAASLFIAERFSSALERLTSALRMFGEEGKVDQVPLKGSGEIRDALGAFNKMVVDRQGVEEKLQDSETRFRTLVEQAADAFFIHDVTGRILDVNQQACHSLGFTRDELLSMTVADIDAVSVKHDYQEKIWEKLEPGIPITLEGTHLRKDGTVFPVEVRVGLLIIHGRRYILALARNITERKKREEELRHAQKMEAIGNLAGGVAHDFNNILTAIFGNLELARLELDKSSSVQEKLERINLSAIRAKELVQQILTFSRKTDEKKKALRIDDILKEDLKLLRSSIPATIKIDDNIASRSAVLADPTQMHQIIMNLCTNAYHAMRENGGSLGVVLRDVDITPDDTTMGLKLAPGRYVLLEVSDTGCGMTEEVKAKIFEPYFTTKGAGRGTGLGLAVVHGIVARHDGSINVYSEPGGGTTFQVYLPVCDAEIPQEEPETASPSVMGGTEHIMLVDDEEDNAASAGEILRRNGYRVDVYTNGVQAWQEFQKQPDAYDLVITDMTMPFMTGAELAQKIIEIRPGQPIILCTGYSEMINREKSIAMGIRRYIQKPMTMSMLVRSVRQVLDNPEEPSA